MKITLFFSTSHLTPGRRLGRTAPEATREDEVHAHRDLAVFTHQNAIKKRHKNRRFHR